MGTGLVGSIIGEVSALPSSGSTLSDNGQGYDVAIGGLGFKLGISDERKYERATAQFRKEQFDNSGSYGDQSLLGYWTVGQFSFHKGAGVRYYEPTDETVLNRYRDAVGVDPFTKKGETTLCKAFTDTCATVTSVTDAAAGLNFIAIVDNGAAKYGQPDVPLSTYTLSAGTATGVACGPNNAYYTTTSNKIERVNANGSGAASGVLYTHTQTWQSITYAKERLWAIDTLGDVYALSPNPAAPPVAVGAGNKVFSVPSNTATAWSVTDTPGPVLFGDRLGRIFSVTVDQTGAVPTLSAPVQVAQLPEPIYGLSQHLGFVVIVTNGVRIGVLSDSGTLTYGPILVDFVPRTGATGLEPVNIARKGSSIFVAGSDPADPSGVAAIYEVNLANQIGSTLEFGWSKLATPFTAFTYTAGLIATAFGWMWVYGGDVLLGMANILPPSGYLTTGYLRMGTLEPKSFQTVRIRFGGTGGTITVYRVNSDGSEVSLYTADVLTTSDDEITLGLSSPVELIGLKFVLTRSATDNTKGPTLLGYQLRALPAPKRQRLIRIPLMLMDVERRGVTQANGYEGSAWDRLQTLEDMEQSGGTFQFQDFRTGEAGTVFIESVEHAGGTPPGKQSSGFGGFVFVTLRKL